MAAGQVLVDHNAKERVEPASITKLMTAYLVFSALKQGSLKLEQEITVSEKAWKAEGSRMFIEVNKQVSIDDLLKGMIVQSGNDASIALAEAVSGSEEAFAQKMNEEAKRLGMANTQFKNATGLPDKDHYSNAEDLAKLATALIRDYPEAYARYYSLKEFTYNKIRQPNRNRLLFLDPTADGVKTGFTDAAGYCLVGSAKRGERRLLSVVMGTASDNARAQESLKLLNFGFLQYDAAQLYAKDQTVSELKVWKGDASKVKAGFFKNFVLSIPQGQAANIKTELISKQPLIAPIPQGTEVATLRVSLGDKSLGEYPVFALEEVKEAGFFGRIWDTILMWFS